MVDMVRSARKAVQCSAARRHLRSCRKFLTCAGPAQLKICQLDNLDDQAHHHIPIHSSDAKGLQQDVSLSTLSCR